MMDRVHLLTVVFPIFLFCSDLIGLFTPPPPTKPSGPSQLHHFGHHHSHHHAAVSIPHVASDPFSAPEKVQIRGTGYGTTVELKFCASCSYRGTAFTMKKMLETSFPGIDVILSNYPPALPKRLISKVIPVIQVGAVAVVMAGDQIFPRLGMVPPPWYYSLRANRFGTIATTWLLGNVLQSLLQSSGAFEVHCNGELVFSKLNEKRFPSEIELKDLVQRRLSGSAFWGTN